MIDSKEQRLNMVESQVRPSDITDRRIIRAMLEVPREAFVAEAVAPIAYMDADAPVTGRSNGQVVRHLLAPRVLAKLVQLASIEADSSVLDVGCATGYSTAILAKIARKVVGLEADSVLAAAARDTLRKLGVANAAIVEGPLAAGAPAQAPFHAIILNGAVPQVPAALLEQLTKGGRLVAVIAGGRLGHARVWQRIGQTYDSRVAFDAGAEPLPGFETKAEFVF